MLEVLTHSFAVLIGFLGGTGGAIARTILSRLVARLLILMSNSRWRTTLDNIRRAYPEATDEWVETIARQSYRNFATCYVELFSTAFMTPGERTSMFALEEDNDIVANREQGKGAIVLSAHIGNWELAVPATAELADIHAMSIAKRQRNRRMNELINRCRTSDRVRVVPMDEAARDIVRTLNSAGFVCMMLDQAADPRKDVFVDFFGRPAVTFEAPATLALRFRADIIVAFAIRSADGKYAIMTRRVSTDGIDDTEHGRRELVQRCTNVIEDVIRQYPGQWSWQHKRWKYDPSDFQKGHRHDS
ncbi:MAG: lysophospholipid acyltransferase family protein [Candidatus Kapaibacterium sp.]